MKKKKLVTYLAGAIEKAPDLGVGWRNKLTPFLVENDIVVLDPCKLEDEKLGCFQFNRLPKNIKHRITGKLFTPQHWHELKFANFNTAHYKRFVKYMSKIIQDDLDLIDQCDYMIVLWDEYAARGAGTTGEITYCARKGIPVLIVSQGEIPAWNAGGATKIFANMEDLKKWLEKNSQKLQRKGKAKLQY